MDKGSGLLTPGISAPPKAPPRLRLLIHWESPRRVFLRNLADVLSFRSVPPVPITARRARFWSDVFVESGVPWRGLLQSILWHVLAIAALWSFPRELAPQQRVERPKNFQSYVSYYTPSQSFPALGSSGSRIRARPGTRNDLADRPVTAKAQRPSRSINTSPGIKITKPGSPDTAASTPAPSAILDSDTRRLPLAAPASMTWVVAPPPAVSQTTSRRLGLPERSVVAPPPAIEAISGRRGVAGPSAAVVAPQPMVQVPMRGVGNINIGHSEVIAPAPVLPMREQRAISGMAGASLGSPGAAVVPPPPSVQHSGMVGDGRAGSLPSAGFKVVPPPPSIQGTGSSTGGGRVSSLSGTGSQVVPPPPSIQGAGNSTGTGRGSSLSGSSSQVVPPPPSFQGAGNSTGTGRGTLLSGVGSHVVPPAPSIQGTGNSIGSVRSGSLSGVGSQVVTPAPSVQGAGNSTGSVRSGSLSGVGSQVVPPAPSVQGAGNSIGSGRGTSSSGVGSQVVPPPPSIQGTGNSTGSGRVASLSGTGSQVVPPPPSIQGAGNSTGSGRSGSLSGTGSQAGPPAPSTPEGANSAASGRPVATGTQPADAPPKVTEKQLGQGMEEMSVRLVGLALSLPNSSYFSNYEVFIAERRIKNAQSQFIKLVYESLPYQRRLSEYALNSAKVFKLRVRRDLSCDESLLQMTWPEGDPHPGAQDSSDSPGLTASDRNSMLPCYRTTADDYRKALSHGR
jgi:hypothetical protein